MHLIKAVLSVCLINQSIINYTVLGPFCSMHLFSCKIMFIRQDAKLSVNIVETLDRPEICKIHRDHA